MTRRRITRRAEMRDLRERAVRDAAEIERLRDLVERARAERNELRAALFRATYLQEKETPGHEGRGHHTNKEHTR